MQTLQGKQQQRLQVLRIGGDGGVDGHVAVDGHRDVGPLLDQAAQPGGVERLVGQQQVVVNVTKELVAQANAFKLRGPALSEQEQYLIFIADNAILVDVLENGKMKVRINQVDAKVATIFFNEANGQK